MPARLDSAMKIGILGSGDVGRSLGSGFASKGHDVTIGTRNPNKAELRKWLRANDGHASVGTFAEAAAHGDLVILATHGDATEGVLDQVGRRAFDGKLVIDATNPLAFEDGARFITSALDGLFDTIAREVPGFFVGRFDVRFESIDRLEQGEGLTIIEINGIGGESIDVWDPSMPLGEVYRRLFRQQSTLFAIGAHNRARGFRPQSAGGFLRCALRQQWLIRRYPASG